MGGIYVPPPPCPTTADSNDHPPGRRPPKSDSNDHPPGRRPTFGVFFLAPQAPKILIFGLNGGHRGLFSWFPGSKLGAKPSKRHLYHFVGGRYPIYTLTGAEGARKFFRVSPTTTPPVGGHRKVAPTTTPPVGGRIWWSLDKGGGGVQKGLKWPNTLPKGSRIA